VTLALQVGVDTTNVGRRLQEVPGAPLSDLGGSNMRREMIAQGASVFIGRRALAAAVVLGAMAVEACSGGSSRGVPPPVAETSSTLTVAQQGLIKDQDGNPVARARVEVLPPNGRRPVAHASTDADGRFVLTVPPGSYDILVTRGALSPQLFPAQSISGAAQLELVIYSFVQAAVSGQVLVPGGQGVPGVVACVSGNCVTTDDTGAFALTGKAGDRLSLNGEVSGATFSVSRTLDAAAAGAEDIFVPICTLRGQLIDPSGAPVTEVVTPASCYQVAFAGYEGTACVDTFSNTPGSFQYQVLPGDVPLLVSGPSRALLVVTVPPGGLVDVTLQMPSPVTLSGRLVDRDGNPLPAQNVCLGRNDCATKFCRQPLCTGTDADGSYQFDVPPGDYQLLLESSPDGVLGQYFFSQDLTLSEPTEIDVTIPNRRLTGQVLEPDGTPAVGAAVSLPGCFSSSVDAFTGEVCGTPAVTDTAGRFEMTTAGPGAGTLFVTAGSISNSVAVDIADDTNVEVTLRPAGPVVGQVVDADGQGVPGQTVCYESVTFDRFCTTTDAGGQYTLDLLPGSYTVNMTVSGLGSDLSLFTIDVNRSVPPDPDPIRIPAIRQLSGQVLGPDGAPLAGASVAPGCQSQADTGAFACAQLLVTDAAGRFHTSVLQNAPLSLQITPPPSSGPGPFSVDLVPVDGDLAVTIALQSGS
jgi:hypothetical protein